MRGNHNLQFKQTHSVLDLRCHCRTSQPLLTHLSGLLLVLWHRYDISLLIGLEAFSNAYPCKISHWFYMFLWFPFNEKNNLRLWWMTVSKLYIFLNSCLISKRKTVFMCSLTLTTLLNQPTQIKHIASKPPCREIAFVFPPLSVWEELHWYIIIKDATEWLCMKTATRDAVEEVERFQI